MSRFHEELRKKGLVYEPDEMGGFNAIEAGAEFVAIEKGFIITFNYCNVLDAKLHIYDRNLQIVGQQNAWKKHQCCNEKPSWDSEGITEDEFGRWTLPSTTPPKVWM